MDEIETISSNKDTTDATSQKRGDDCNRGDEPRRCAFECLIKAVDHLELSKVECAQRALRNGHIYLLALTPESFNNPTDYEKQQVKRAREISLKCVSGPPLCGVILLDQMDSDQDDHLYITFTIAFGALAFKLQEHNMAIEVFNLVMNSNGSPPHREITVDFEFSVVVAKANLGCVYLILGQLEKAKENLECALKSLERFRLEKNIGNVEVEIFAVENNLSLVLQGQQNYTESIKLQNDLVAKAKHLLLPSRMVSATHYNRAELFLELEYPGKALKELQELKSLSEFVDDENGMPEEFISSKICLVHLSMKEMAPAEEIAVKLSLSPSFSFFLPSISSSWLPTSSSLSSSSLTSSSLLTSLSSSSSSSSSSSLSSSSLKSSSLSTSLSSSSSSSSSSSLASSSSSSSTSPPSSPPPSSSEFEFCPKSNGKLPSDFSVATLANLVDFYLYQENVQRLSMILDLCVSNWKETFGESHPAFASLLYRQGVKFSLMRQNVSSKNCFEEALSIFTRSGFALTHPEVSKCNAGLARLLFCESSQDEMFLSSQSIPRTPSDSDEGCKKSQELIFSDSITSSSLFEKLVKQIIKSQEKFGEISELVMTKHLLKIQGPSVGQITVWLHDRSIKMTTQPTHAKKSLAANYEESFSSDRTNINEILVEEMKMCASALGVSFETFTETSLCPSPCQTTGELLMNPASNVKAMNKASNGGQNSFEDGEAGASASFSPRGMAEKVLENPCVSLLPRTMTDQKLISGEKFSFPSHGQNNEEEISAEIAPCCSFSKVDEKKAKEDSVVLSIRDFSQYRHGESRAMKEEPYTTSKPKRKAASDQSTYESRFSPVTLKAVKGQTLMNRAQQVTGTHEHSSVKPYVDDDQQENFADDVTDGVSTFQFCPPEGITEEQDHNKEQERKLRTSNQECHGKEKVVNIERSPNQDGVKRMGISRNRKERQSLAYWKENDANNSFCGEEDVADNGNAKHVVEVRGACGYQNKDFQNADTPKESKDDSRERGSTKKPIESLGLKGGRRDEFSANNSSLCAVNIPCISESSHLGIKSGFLARHSNDNSMSCSVDETDYEGILDCTNFCQFPDCAECSSRDIATSSITALRSPAQSFLNFNSYQPEQSLSLPYNSKYSSPKNEEILSLPPPQPPRRPQFPSLPYNVPQERHYVSQTNFDTGAFQSRTWHSVDPGASNSSTWFGGFTTPESGTGLGGHNTGINQREIRRSAFPVHLTSNTPDLIYEQAERAMRQRERERMKRETAMARVSTDGDSTTTQPSLPNSNAETTSDGDSLAALERRVAEACSMVERVLKEREEKEKAIKEREQRQRKERAKRELQEQESRARESRETMQRNGNGEGTSTVSEEEAPSQRVALPENPQWLCEHYQRLCRVKFPCCGRFYPCHRCHNNSGECENDHCKAKEAFYIECSVCRHQQEINRDAHTCARCNTRMSAYFCAICKHFTGEDKHPYHCTKCGICRIHKDRSFHCDVCNVCLDKRLQGKHKCRPDSGHDECCICLEAPNGILECKLKRIRRSCCTRGQGLLAKKILPNIAKHFQGLAVFAKELCATIHQLKIAALGGDSASGSSGGGTPSKPKPPNLGEGVNKGDEESLELTLEKNRDGSCKPATFEMFSILKGLSKEVHDPEQDELVEK